MKKLSIITINYNNRDGLRKTIESVVAQTTRDFEYIVIDGGSTDGSVDVIKEYASYIDYWVSEPDKGIYNAMNKGVRAATGLFCQFLNSGDWLNSTVVVEVVNQYLTCDIDILSGQTVICQSNGKVRRHMPPLNLSVAFFIQLTLPHPSTFIRKRLLLKRPYRETLRIVSDWVFFFEAFLYDNIRYGFIDVDMAVFDNEGISSTNYKLLSEERDEFISSLSSEILLRDYRHVPYEICGLFNSIPRSHTYKNILKKIDSLLFTGYGCIKQNAVVLYNNSVSYTPSKISIKTKKGYRLLR